MQLRKNKIRGHEDAEKKCGGCFGSGFPKTVLASPQKKSLIHLSTPSSFQSMVRNIPL